MSDFVMPADLAKSLVEVSEKKASIPVVKLFVLGILAGIYIGFAAHLATVVGTGTFGWLGFKKFIIGSVFSVGLMLVMIPGSELWTGNNLMVVGLLQRKITLGGLLKNWTAVYLGNIVGSVILAFIIAKSSGLLDGAVGGTAINLAYGKVATQIEGVSHNYAYFFKAIGCNWLVCLAVMMALAAKDIAGKVLAIYFPIMAFVASGFEHCVANMYFIPAGIFAKGFNNAVIASGQSVERLQTLNWSTMWTQNLLTVTVGNFVGGALFVGVVYWYLYVKDSDKA